MADPLDDQLGKVNELNSAVATLQQAIVSMNDSINVSIGKVNNLTNQTSKVFNTNSLAIKNLTTSLDRYGKTSNDLISKNTKLVKQLDQALSKVLKSDVKNTLSDIFKEVEKITDKLKNSGKEAFTLFDNTELDKSLDNLKKVEGFVKSIEGSYTKISNSKIPSEPEKVATKKKKEKPEVTPELPQPDITSPTRYRIPKGQPGAGQFAKNPTPEPEIKVELPEPKEKPPTKSTQLYIPENVEVREMQVNTQFVRISGQSAKVILEGNPTLSINNVQDIVNSIVSKVKINPTTSVKPKDSKVELPEPKEKPPTKSTQLYIPENVEVREMQINTQLVRISGQSTKVILEGNVTLSIRNLQDVVNSIVNKVKINPTPSVKPKDSKVELPETKEKVTRSRTPKGEPGAGQFTKNPTPTPEVKVDIPKPEIKVELSETKEQLPTIPTQLNIPEQVNVRELQITSQFVRISGPTTKVVLEGNPTLSINNIKDIVNSIVNKVRINPNTPEERQQIIGNQPRQERTVNTSQQQQPQRPQENRRQTNNTSDTTKLEQSVNNLNNQFDMLNRQILNLSLRQQQYGRVSTENSERLLDDALDYSNILEDHVRQIRFQQAEKRRLLKINRDIVNDAFIINSATYETLAVDTKRETIVKRQKQIQKDLVDLEYLRARMVMEDPERQLEITQSIEKQKESLRSANSEYEKQKKIIDSINNDKGVRTYSIFADIAKSIPGLRKFADPFKDAAEAAKKQAASNEQIKSQKEWIKKHNQEILAANKKIETSDKQILAVGKHALQTGNGLTREKLKQLKLDHITKGHGGTVAAWLLNKQLMLNKATRERNKDLIDANNKQINVIKKGSTLWEGFKGFGGGIMKMLGPIGTIGGIIGGIVGLFAKIKDLMFAIDKENADFAHSMNMTKVEAAELRFELFKAGELTNVFVDRFNGARIQMQNFANQTGIIANNTGVFNAELDTTERRLGLSEQQTAQLAQNILISGQNTKDYRDLLLGSAKAAQIANGANIQIQSTMKDVLNLTAAQTLSLGKQPELIGRTIGQVRSLGLSMASLEATAGSLLEFESSIESELEAELLLGRELNLERARAAAAINDYSTLAAEVSEQIGTSAEFGEMSRFQQEALAKTFGYQKDELAKILLEQDSLKAAGFASVALRDKEYERLRKIHGEREALRLLGDQQFEREKTNVAFQEKMNTLVHNLKVIFIESIQPSLQKILSLFESQEGNVSSIVNKVKNLGVKVGEVVYKGVKWLTDTDRLKGYWEKIKGIFHKVKETAVETFDWLKQNGIPVAKQIFTIFKGMGKILYAGFVMPLKTAYHTMSAIYNRAVATKRFLSLDYSGALEANKKADEHAANALRNFKEQTVTIVRGVKDIMDASESRTGISKPGQTGSSGGGEMSTSKFTYNEVRKILEQSGALKGLSKEESIQLIKNTSKDLLLEAQKISKEKLASKQITKSEYKDTYRSELVKLLETQKRIAETTKLAVEKSLGVKTDKTNISTGLGTYDYSKFNFGGGLGTNYGIQPTITPSVQPTIESVPKMATGGVITEPTLVQAGEAGPEAIIPLTALYEKLDEMIRAINNQNSKPGYINLDGYRVGEVLSIGESNV